MEPKFMKTDTAGVMFGTLNHAGKSRIVRIACILNEEVDPVVLDRAVRDMTPSFPAFRYGYFRGFFTGQLRFRESIPPVEQEHGTPAEALFLGVNGYPEFRFRYSGRRIALDSAHILADGTGISEFLKSVVLRYFELQGVAVQDPSGIRQAGYTADEREFENSYIRYFDKNIQLPPAEKKEPAFRFESGAMKNGHKVVHVQFPGDAFHAQAKKRGMTVTEFAAALLTKAVLQSAKREVRAPVVVEVAANMRKFLPTVTLRNFSTDFPVSYMPVPGEKNTLDEICHAVAGQIKVRTNEENMLRFIRSTYGMATNPVVRVLPLFIMNNGLRSIQKATHKKNMTIVLSNLGNVKMPAEIADRISHFEMVGGDPGAYGMTKFVGMVGYGNTIDMTFSLNNNDTETEACLVHLLRELDIPVSLRSSVPADTLAKRTGLPVTVDYPPAIPAENKKKTALFRLPAKDEIKAYFSL